MIVYVQMCKDVIYGVIINKKRKVKKKKRLILPAEKHFLNKNILRTYEPEILKNIKKIQAQPQK